MIPIKSNVVSGVVLSKDEDVPKILMMKRIKGEFWCHVAGKIEQDETAVEAIVREVREETGIIVKALYSAEFMEQFYEHHTNHILMIPAFVIQCPADQAITLNDEHVEYRWCTIQEALSLASFPNQEKLYRHISEYFIQRKPTDYMQINLS